MQIKVLEDLKGNMPEKDTIIIWEPLCLLAGRVDGFERAENDTLCLFIYKGDPIGYNREDCEEPGEYYGVFACTYSIVCFSEDYITGYIYSYEISTILFADFLDGISDIANIGFNQNTRIYPNPVNSHLFIDSQNGYYPVKAQIYNSIGMLVTNIISLNKPVLELDVSSLNSGFYIIQLTDNNNRSLTLNFMKQ